MHEEHLDLPESLPLPGFYYHYKHDPEGPEDNYVYELVGVGLHTEEDCRPEDQFVAVYRPLYESALVFRSGKLFDIRPLGMFMETVEKEGQTMPRFTYIEDPLLIQRLSHKRDQMYFF
jgi:hypothetical protein